MGCLLWSLQCMIKKLIAPCIVSVCYPYLTKFDIHYTCLYIRQESRLVYQAWKNTYRPPQTAYSTGCYLTYILSCIIVKLNAITQDVSNVTVLMYIPGTVCTISYSTCPFPPAETLYKSMDWLWLTAPGQSWTTPLSVKWSVLTHAYCRFW